MNRMLRETLKIKGMKEFYFPQAQHINQPIFVYMIFESKTKL